jgi:hypothetical protein
MDHEVTVTVPVLAHGLCDHCSGPLPEAVLVDQRGWRFCDIVCAEASAVEHKGRRQHGPDPETAAEKGE